MLVDVNLLVYAVVSDSAHHSAALGWLEDQLNGQARLGLPWESLVGFVRLTTNPRVFERPLSVAQAWDNVCAWLESPAVWIPHPTAEHAGNLAALLPYASSPGLVHDAHLGALALDHGLTVCSTDGDFARFPGLRWVNPLPPAA